jgi:hypothetical protein
MEVFQPTDYSIDESGAVTPMGYPPPKRPGGIGSLGATSAKKRFDWGSAALAFFGGPEVANSIRQRKTMEEAQRREDQERWGRTLQEIDFRSGLEQEGLPAHVIGSIMADPYRTPGVGGGPGHRSYDSSAFGERTAGNLGAFPTRINEPMPGTVQSGYRFKCGNPADPSAWEPARSFGSRPWHPSRGSFGR